MAFFAISDYSSMLNRIGWVTLFAWILAIAALSVFVAPIHAVLSQGLVKVPNTDVQVPAGVLGVAAILAGLSRAFKLHDRVSDLFGIRQRFDVKEILLPMAAAAGVRLSIEQQGQVEVKRRELMGQVFYKYVSSTATAAVIDRHVITMALDQWSWYWIVVEAAAVALTTSAVGAWFGATVLAFWLLVGVLGALWVLPHLRKQSVRYAQDQIKLILEDSAREETVSKAFRAL